MSHGVCFCFQCSLLIVLFTTAALPLDISSDNPEVIASEIERDLKRYYKYYNDDDRTVSSIEDTRDNVAALQKLSGFMHLKNSISGPVIDIHAEIDESESYASISNEKSDNAERIDNHEIEHTNDDRTASSVEGTNDNVAASQKLSGTIMQLKKSKSGPVVGIHAKIDESESYTSISNEKSDNADIDNHEIEHKSLQDNDIGDKNIYQDEKNSNFRPSSTAKDRRNQPIVFPSEHEYDFKRLAVLPGLKLSPSEMIKFKIWPEAKIPFFIDEFSYDKVLRDKIRGYLEHAETLTGLNFLELANPPEDENERWVFFVNRRGQLDCKDYSTKSFTNSGVQKVIIGYDCLQNSGPMATIVLALAGVPPQHNAPNRDRYINVSMKSILSEKRGLFKRLDDKDWLFHDLHYDYYSVGHYSSHKYTADGSATITAYSESLYMKNDEDDTYSTTDIQKIRLLYNNILRNLPRMNLELCKNFFRPRTVQLKTRISKKNEPKVRKKNLLN